MQNLGQARCWKWMLGGDVDRRPGKAVWCGELSGQQEREEKLGFAGAAGQVISTFALEVWGFKGKVR